MPAPRVERVQGRRALAAFVDLPYRLHRGDPGFAPVLRRDVHTLLSPRRNPFYEHAEAAHFLAREGGRVVGRISAIHNRRHNETHGDRVGFFGFFECIDAHEVARALFQAAEEWLRGRGLTVMRGPVNPSINDEAGLLVDGFTTPSVLMMPHNPLYYVALVEGAGFRKAKDLLAYEHAADELPLRLVQGATRQEVRHGITLRTLDMRRFEAECEIVKTLYNQAWERNWGFVPMTDRELAHLATQLKPVVVPELVVFAEQEGRPIGFAVALPDLNVALRKNPSGRFFPGILRILWAARRIDRVRVVLLGVVPPWKGRGIDVILYKTIWEAARRKGFTWGEAGWILEDNHAMANGLLRMGFRAYKTYRLYDRDIGTGGTVQP
jgi:GNAT superfamily N-acetyltransferase